MFCTHVPATFRPYPNTDRWQVEDVLVHNMICADKPALMDPKAYFLCTGHYALTQGDVDEGVVRNEVKLTLEQLSPCHYFYFKRNGFGRLREPKKRHRPAVRRRWQAAFG